MNTLEEMGFDIAVGAVLSEVLKAGDNPATAALDRFDLMGYECLTLEANAFFIPLKRHTKDQGGKTTYPQKEKEKLNKCE